MDSIIDLTISLESLIEGISELRYRFALYNSWVAEKAPDRRQNAYHLLLKLYDARSRMVHGSSADKNDKIIKPTIENWPELISIAKNVLGYYLLFLYKNSLEDWYHHFKGFKFRYRAKDIIERYNYGKTEKKYGITPF